MESRFIIQQSLFAHALKFGEKVLNVRPIRPLLRLQIKFKCRIAKKIFNESVQHLQVYLFFNNYFYFINSLRGGNFTHHLKKCA